MDDTWKAILVLFLLAALVFFIVLGPVFSIWALNCLFKTEIPVCFPTWCAMAWLHLVIAGTSVKAKNNN
jgi:uncharacterized RDD family membrane protein YckC